MNITEEELKEREQLTKAIVSGDVPTVRSLFSKIDPNEKTDIFGFPTTGPSRSWTHLAASKGVPDTLRACFEAGGNPDAGDASGRTPLHRVAIDIKDEKTAEEMVAICKKAGANLEARDDVFSRTPLFLAIQYNSPEVLRIFLDAGCDPLATDEFRYTPGDFAALEARFLHFVVWSEYVDESRMLESLRFFNAASSVALMLLSSKLDSSPETTGELERIYLEKKDEALFLVQRLEEPGVCAIIVPEKFLENLRFDSETPVSGKDVCALLTIAGRCLSENPGTAPSIKVFLKNIATVVERFSGEETVRDSVDEVLRLLVSVEEDCADNAVPIL